MQLAVKIMRAAGGKTVNPQAKMTPFFVPINGFEARVRVHVTVQSLSRAVKQLGNVALCNAVGGSNCESSWRQDGEPTGPFQRSWPAPGAKN